MLQETLGSVIQSSVLGRSRRFSHYYFSWLEQLTMHLSNGAWNCLHGYCPREAALEPSEMGQQLTWSWCVSEPMSAHQQMTCLIINFYLRCCRMHKCLFSPKPTEISIVKYQISTSSLPQACIHPQDSLLLLWFFLTLFMPFKSLLLNCSIWVQHLVPASQGPLQILLLNLSLCNVYTVLKILL